IAADPDHSELVCGRIRQVDDALTSERPAVVDADNHRFAGPQAGYARVARNGKGWMRSSHRIHVVRLARSSGLALIAFAIPASRSALFERSDPIHRGIDPTKYGIRPRRGCFDGLIFRIGIRDTLQISGRTGSRSIVEVVAPRTLPNCAG